MGRRRQTAIRIGLTSVILAVLAASCSGASAFQGTALERADLAPQFSLVDQYGAPATLADSRGRVVVLAFLYTRCPDVCPIVTETLRRSHDLLGEDAEQVDFLAISVDPERDSVERAYEYSEERGMLERWRFLVGNEDQLEPVWKSYWLDPVRGAPDSPEESHGDDHDGTGSDGGGGPVLRTDSGDYLVSHTAPVFIIDRQGYRRVLFTDLSLDPKPLVHDVRLLLKQLHQR